MTSGSGRKQDNDGIYNTEIDQLMKVFTPRGYLGAISFDRLPDILQLNKVPEEFSVIVNEDKSGQTGSHWVAIFTTAKTIEYYDSFARPPMPEIKQWMTDLAKKLGGGYQIKINRIPNQFSKSSNCGYLAMRFIVDRYSDKSFKDATNFSSIEKSEKDIERWKDHILNFETI